MEKRVKITGYHMVQKLGRTKKVIKVGEMSEKYDFLTVEGKIVNKTKRSLEMTPGKRDLEAIWLKASKI